MKWIVFCCVFATTVLHCKAQSFLHSGAQKPAMEVKVTSSPIAIMRVKFQPLNQVELTEVTANVGEPKNRRQNEFAYEFKYDSLKNSDHLTNQKKGVLKIHLLSPLFAHFGVSYEKSTKQGRSNEFGIGIIGIGSQYIEGKTYGGVFARAGKKFFKYNKQKDHGLQSAHFLQGSYTKPELILGYYQVFENIEMTGKGPDVLPVSFGGFLINAGKQWIVDDMIVLDFYLGFGLGIASYSGQNSNLASQIEIYHFAYWGGHRVFPMAISAGFKVGILVGKKSKHQNTKLNE